jgi:hypothetical protein
MYGHMNVKDTGISKEETLDYTLWRTSCGNEPVAKQTTQWRITRILTASTKTATIWPNTTKI